MKQKDLLIIEQAALKAGRLLVHEKKNATSKHILESKRDGSYSVHADKLSEQAIISHITKHITSPFTIISEEMDNQVHVPGWSIIIDPLDGTYNYTRDLAYYAVSIGVAYDMKPVGGVIYLPETKELLRAWQGKGAFCNGKRIRFSPQYPKKLIGLDGKSARFKKGLVSEISKEFRWLRMMSQASTLAYVALSRLDGCVLLSDYAWDVAAGMVIIQEAGGTVRDAHKRTLLVDAKTVVVGNTSVARKLVSVCKKLQM